MLWLNPLSTTIVEASSTLPDLLCQKTRIYIVIAPALLYQELVIMNGFVAASFQPPTTSSAAAAASSHQAASSVSRLASPHKDIINYPWLVNDLNARFFSSYVNRLCHLILVSLSTLYLEFCLVVSCHTSI